MPLITADFVTRLSGGAANATGNASLGGAKSANAAPATLNGLFDQTSSAEAAAGDVEYRCVYLHNGNASSEMQAAVAYITSNTPSTTTTIDIGVGSAAVNGIEQTVVDESTAPTGVTFSAPGTAAAGIALGAIPAGQHRAVWIRRTITAAAVFTNNDPYTIEFKADFVS